MVAETDTVVRRARTHTEKCLFGERFSFVSITQTTKFAIRTLAQHESLCGSGEGTGSAVRKTEKEKIRTKSFFDDTRTQQGSRKITAAL